MRHRVSLASRLIAFAALPLVPASLALAQATPRAPAERPPAAAPAAPAAPGGQGDSPIETFDLDKALVSESGGLTAEEVGKRTRARSPQIRSAEATATVAEWNARSTWVGFVPQVRVFAQYRRISEVLNNTGPTPEQQADLALLVEEVADPAAQTLLRGLTTNTFNFTQPPNNYSLGANLTIPVSDMFLRVWPAYEGSKTIIDAQKLQAESTAETVELQGKSAFYGYAAAVARRTLQEQAVRQAELSAGQSQLFVSAGTKAPVDLLAATAELERQRGLLAQAEGEVAVARARVAVLAGMNENEVQAIGEPITTLPEMPKQPLPELVNRAVEHRVEMRALRKAITGNEHVYKAERNAALPQLSLEGGALYANPNPRYVPPEKEFNTTWEVGATLSWTPNQALSGKYGRSRVSAEIAKQRADLQTMEEAVRIEVIQAYENLRAFMAAAAASEPSVKAAEEAYRVRVATYRVGAGVLLELTEADRRVTEARSLFVSYVIQARLALAQLERSAALD